ncbi:MAG: peptidylprolyl isomerase [Planctomycetes bacterium]|jgi:hypothetical protein|nr:peptidylprolyl isomerase [Planctomycetota bacterium]MCL4731028.1 peptidylprolyl isomerase [Planctomycetota bacterium]
MRRFRLMLAVLAAGAVAGLAAGYQTGAQERRTLKANQVARVGQSVITAEQLVQRLVEAEKLLPATDRRVGPVLDLLVAERMLELEAARIDPITGGQIKPREIRQEVEAMMAQARALLEAENKKLLEDQKRAGQPQRPYTWGEWLELRLKITETEYDQLLQIRARNDLLKRMVVWYWFRSSRNINVMVIQCASEDAIKDVQQRLTAGEDMAMLAAARSIHGSARQNTPGLLAEIIRGDGSLPKTVDDAAWKLEDGRTSGIIQDGKSWFIVRRLATNRRIPNEARFVDQREDCLAAPNVSDALFERWRNAVANSGLYAYEERLPGRNAQADE